MKKILLAFTILSNVVFGQRDLKIDEINPNDLLLIGIPFDHLLIGETKTAFPFEYNYGAFVYKVFNPKTGKVCGYLPHTFDNISHPYHIREKKLYTSGNYFVFVSEYTISVYNKTGKFIRDITRNYDAGNNRFLSLNFSDDFKQVCFLQEGDIFVATIDLTTGKISNEKQITYVGNFVENYNGRIHMFKSNIILANSESGKMHWVNTITNEVKETAVGGGYLSEIFTNGKKLKIESQSRMRTYFGWNDKIEGDELKLNGYLLGFNIDRNSTFNIKSNKNVDYFTFFVFPSINSNEGIFALLSGSLKNELIEYDIYGKELNRIIVPNNWGMAYTDSPLFPSLDKTFWARGINKNVENSEVNNKKNEVLNLKTGVIKEFISNKYKISQIGWISDDLMIFSVLDESTFMLWGPSEYYPSSETGTYIFDAKNNKLKKIFNYIISEGDFHSKLNSDGSVYFVANKNIWKYNYITGEKSKITKIASENITIITSK